MADNDNSSTDEEEEEEEELNEPNSLKVLFVKNQENEEAILLSSLPCPEVGDMPNTASPIDNGKIKMNEIPNMNPKSTDDPNSEDLRYGYGTFKPKWMQIFNTSQALLVFLSISCFIQGFIVNGVINVNMTTLERRFGFTSSNSGWIASIYDLTAAPLALFVTFIGTVGYKPRWLGSGLISLGIGSFIMTLPHFTTENYHLLTTQMTLCSSDHKSCNMSAKGTNLSKYLYVFLLGQILHSASGCILYTLGVTCLDDVVKQRTAPMYVGIMMFFATLGPAFGYILGGHFLNTYVDFNRVSVSSIPKHLDSKDPQWVGAWWICFLISGTFALLIGPVLLGYAKELPVAKEIRASRESEAHQNHKSTKLRNPAKGATLKDLPAMIGSLVTNPSFMLVCLASANEGILLAGISTFLPKFIENQFSQTASWASMLAGIVGVPSAAGGQFLGGYLCKKLGLDMSGKFRFTIITLGLGLFMSAVFWAKCDKEQFAGITVPYSQRLSLTSPATPTDSTGSPMINPVLSTCNNRCNCNVEFFNPVCGSDGIQYFSSCHAGCIQYNKSEKVYHNCACVSPSNKTAAHAAVAGKCPHQTCVYFHIALLILFFFIFTTFLAQTPIIAITLRCVPDDFRTFAIGIASFNGRLLGTLPGPLLFGFAIDKSCLVWKRNSCGSRLSCWIYEDRILSRNFFILSVVIRIFSIFFMFLANYLYKPPPDPSEVDLASESPGKDNPAYVGTESIGGV